MCMCLYYLYALRAYGKAAILIDEEFVSILAENLSCVCNFAFNI